MDRVHIPELANPLRKFTAIHIDEDCRTLKGFHENELFYNCKFDDLRDLTLKNCDLNKSEFLTDTIEKALGFTLTLDCDSFKDVKYSDILFDMFLTLAIKSKSDPIKRKQLIDVIGKEKLLTLLTRLRVCER